MAEYFHRRIIGSKLGTWPVNLDRIGSWDSPHYSRFGFWWWDEHRGFTLRYRGWLLMVRLRRSAP